MPELLLEILSEEIPARMQKRAAEDLKRLVGAGLKEAQLDFQSINAFVTPRRLALVVTGLPEAQPDIKEEKKGPQVGAPEQAMAGFNKSLPDGAVVEERDVKGKMFHFAVIDKKGGDTADVLKDVLGVAVNAMAWPKSMRWGAEPKRWVRPMHSILCLFAGKPVAVAYGNVTAADSTSGHRFLKPEPFKVKDFADYKAKLFDAKVMLDADERRTLIHRNADDLAKSTGLTVRPDQGLLDEVTGLVEWPVVLMGDIDDAFMDVPPEVLIAAMRGHQKYFSLLDADGNLAPKFIMVANMETADDGKVIVAGNERVLRARLADARYFWDQDRKVSLASRAPKLQSIVFHAKLGTLDEKVDRIQALATELAVHIPDADKDRVRSAARLAKADLVTGMVAEFPELQGLMGRYYALNDGENENVADAIAEHYSPAGPNDMCPSKPVSVAVALADKIDSLVGFWAIDEKPTGSKDPFALRRAALGVIRLIVENNLRLSLFNVFGTAFDLYLKRYMGKAFAIPKENVAVDLLAFFGDRLIVQQKELGTRDDLIKAVFSVKGEHDLVRALARVEALGDFVASDDGANLLTAYSRAANILKIEEKKDGVSFDAKADEKGLVEADEKAL
ncbi:MAG: glycine--tRNA ligase subunit beta, partial [Rhodospirillaceae bacterium]|nr:glycine--tRNA ligase subunit beta [Rhodospirillaceae bacterium]